MPVLLTQPMTFLPQHAQIRIVMVETTHPGNIGAAARVMKNMGLTQLVLVQPKHFPDDEASARAAGASDVLAQAHVVSSLAEALAPCAYVFGASARLRSVQWPQSGPRELGAQVVQRVRDGQQVAIVLGRESSGLSNAELDLCHALVHVPTNPDYGSLNVASAVQLLCYEVRMAALDADADAGSAVSEGLNRQAEAGDSRADALATSAELENFYAHLEAVAAQTGFLNPDNPRYLLRRMRRIFNRSELSQSEVGMLRGFLASMSAKGRGQ